ncbi:MAG: pseudouridine synthase [Candidatus Woesearchaeota archaeon]
MPIHSLCRIISKMGVMSRKQAAEAIVAGSVIVNGKTAKSPNLRVSTDAEILINNKPIQKPEKIYLLLNKPINYVVTRKDERGRKTIYQLLKTSQWLFPVGRLDYETSGLILLTNDSNFAEYLTNPESHIWKTYIAKTRSNISSEEITLLKNGVRLSEGITLPAKVKRLSDSEVEISIREGKNRQIRRMLAAIGNKARSLKRVAIGDLADDALKSGCYKIIGKEEIKRLFPNV